MSIVHTTNNGHIIVCGDSRGTGQFSYAQPGGNWCISGLTADQCTDLSAALLAEANRQRREDAARFEKCEGCNGHGLVGNILDTDTCQFCHGSGNERREAADNVRLRDIHDALKLDNGEVV